VSNQDTFVWCPPSHWGSGVLLFLFVLLIGGKTEFSAGVWTPEWMWELIRAERATVVADHPSAYQALVDFYRENLEYRPPAERDAYIRGLRCLRFASVTGSQVSQALKQDWNAIPGSTPLINIYGMTEVGTVTWTYPASTEFSKVCSTHSQDKTAIACVWLT
jgi:malonyl-CoA/methylmalonyl-CoA synthetase